MKTPVAVWVLWAVTAVLVFVGAGNLTTADESAPAAFTGASLLCGGVVCGGLALVSHVIVAVFRHADSR